jgi:hypothetical protein
MKINPDNSIANIATRLGVTARRIQQLVVELEIKPASRLGNTRVLAEADVRRIAGKLRPRKVTSENNQKEKQP